MNIGDKIGSFQVLGTLGTGAHSTILHVRRKADGKQYALKVVPLDERRRSKVPRTGRHEFTRRQHARPSEPLKVYALEEQRDWFFRSPEGRTCSSSTSTARRSTRCRCCRCRSSCRSSHKIAAGAGPHAPPQVSATPT